MVVVEAYGISDTGQKRKGNEDSLFLDDDQMLYIVADGMGGHQAGEVASALVVSTIRDYMQRFKDEGAAIEELADPDPSLSRDANRVLSGINLANRVVYQVAQQKDATRGMGSTVSAVCFSGDALIAANVGDSPIYLVRDGAVEELSVPHTVMAEQAAMNPESQSLLDKRFRHMLTRAMGTRDVVEADICEIECLKNDVIVISSDGLSDKLTPEEIKTIVTGDSPENACRILVDQANDRGGEDNITVIVIRVRQVKRGLGLFRYLLRLLGR